MKPRALVTAPFDETELHRLQGRVEVNHEDWHETGKLYMNGDELAGRVKEGYEILIVEADEVDRTVIEENTGILKLIASCRSNPVNVEIETATEHGICVLNAPHRNADAVADLTVGLILSQVRKIAEVNVFLHQSPEFEIEDENDMADFFERFTGFELGGKTVGIVGFGAIGSRVAHRLHDGFEMKVLAYDPYVVEGDPRLGEVEGQIVSLEDLLRRSDIVTLHAAPTPENEGMIGEKEFAMMKPTAHFINTSRAYLVDEDALYRALSGTIAGAGLDVFEDEPVGGDNRFLEFDNVTVTPHIGGATHDVVRHQSRAVVDGIFQWMDGTRPFNLMNPEVWENRGK
jgi:D-3-phosphoglycerate dehydrogenase